MLLPGTRRFLNRRRYGYLFIGFTVIQMECKHWEKYFIEGLVYRLVDQSIVRRIQSNVNRLVEKQWARGRSRKCHYKFHSFRWPLRPIRKDEWTRSSNSSVLKYFIVFFMNFENVLWKRDSRNTIASFQSKKVHPKISRFPIPLGQRLFLKKYSIDS